MEIKGLAKAHQRISHKMPNKAAVKVLDATSKPPISAPQSVQEMTSRDFQRDTHAHIDVTSQLLKDQSTIRNFQLAISLNKHLFRGKTVLDVGCGTGILSLFAAKAGAARVFSVDQSSVVDYTRKIVAANHYENVIEVIHGRIEDICLPVKQVDIILCDWMGYSLLYQSTCEAVIFAREKWLRKDTSAVIFPDIAKLLIAGFQDTQRKNEKIEWWKNVYGFNMKSLREFALKEPCFYAMAPDQIITTDFTVKTINLYTATINDIGVHSLFSLRMLRNGLIDGIVTYFQVGFSKSHIPFIFSTDPWSPHTHWMQSVFFFDQAMPAQVDEILCGGFEMWPADPKKPDLNNIEVSLELCCGEPMQVQVIMHWQLQPHVSNVTPSTPGPISSAPSTAANTAIEEIKESTENMSPFLAAILRRSDNKNMVGRRHKKQGKAKQANLKKDIIYTF